MSNTATREEWLTARKALLEREKSLTRLHDELSAARRALPWIKVEKEYRFEGPDGCVSLSDLFGESRQLIVYHFMYGPDWKEGCPSCSFWADNFNGVDVHLAQRDIAFVAISRAPFDTLNTFRKRMGWNFRWFSSRESDFNFDFHVSFEPGMPEPEFRFYNFRDVPNANGELPGVSVFVKDDNGNIFHTYSAYARGLEIFNGAYNLMDLTPYGRDEVGLAYSMAWVRIKDKY